VVLDLTDSEDSACARTRVDAFLSNAGQASRTVGVLEALGPAAIGRDGIPLKAATAATDHLSRLVFATLGVGAARRGVAGVGGNTALEGISPEAGEAPAVLIPGLANQALRVGSAGSGLTKADYNWC
jgi:hypothetical protein